MDYRFLKGHGTENDFVLLPDHDGIVHGELTAERVRALCDRRAGIGADGVLRVVRTRHLDEAAVGDQFDSQAAPEWFMDYRNSDGGLSEMCGNGIRLFALYLVSESLADASKSIPIGTRDGIKTVTVEKTAEGETITVDLGTPRILEQTKVSVDDHLWGAAHVDMGNPHAVAFVDSLDDAGPLTEQPGYDLDAYPHGVNVEFVVRRRDQHVAMRVHERGVGETRSCGTGAGAVMVATALADGYLADGFDGEGGTTYRVDVPGGSLTLTWAEDGRVLLTGPAVIVAEGTTSL